MSTTIIPGCLATGREALRPRATWWLRGWITPWRRRLLPGQVGLAWIFLGGNDFIEALLSPAREMRYDEIAIQAQKNIDQIVMTLLAASEVLRVVLVTLPNLFQIPEIADDVRSGFLSAAEKATAQKAIRVYNRHLINWADRDSRVITVDLAAMTRVGEVLSPRFIPVGSVRVKRGVAGPELTRRFFAGSAACGNPGSRRIRSVLSDSDEYPFWGWSKAFERP